MYRFDHQLASYCGRILPYRRSILAFIDEWDLVLSADGGERIMPEIQTGRVQLVKPCCRFEMEAGVYSGEAFCAFDLPGCRTCPNSRHVVRTLEDSEDPMNSKTLRAWIACLSRSSPDVVIGSNR